MLFIVIHQVYELWFKELLHEFDRVARLLTGDEPHRAQHTLKRILTILKVMVAQLDILETMTPLEFLSFRARLEAASGFQSDQFRQIEFVLGAKSEGALARFPERQSRARGAARSRYQAPTLWDAFLHYLSREGYRGSRAASLARRHGAGRPVVEVQQILVDVYRRDPKNAELCERLVDLDEGLAGMALPPRQDGRTYDRHEARHRRFERRRVSGDDDGQTAVSRSVGDPGAPPYAARNCAESARHALLAFPSQRTNSADRTFTSGMAGRRIRGAAARVARCGGAGRRQVGARVRAGSPRCVTDSRGCSATSPDNIALGQNTHELVTRWLSALPFADAAAHRHDRRANSTRFGGNSTDLPKKGCRDRQGAGASGGGRCAERIAREIDDRTLAVMVSSVLFETAEIVPELASRRSACERHGVRAARRCLSPPERRSVRCAVRWDWSTRSSRAVATSTVSLARATAFCASRLARGMRPVLTGWFAEFDHLDATVETATHTVGRLSSRIRVVRQRSPVRPTTRRLTIALRRYSTFTRHRA